MLARSPSLLRHTSPPRATTRRAGSEDVEARSARNTWDPVQAFNTVQVSNTIEVSTDPVQVSTSSRRQQTPFNVNSCESVSKMARRAAP